MMFNKYSNLVFSSLILDIFINLYLPILLFIFAHQSTKEKKSGRRLVIYNIPGLINKLRLYIKVKHLKKSSMSPFKKKSYFYIEI